MISVRRYIFDIHPDNFSTMVMENSRRGPVMVYFWSPRAGPCMRLLPRLVRLADEFGGRFLLTLLNTDEHQDFARDKGVISIPTVRIYHRDRLAENVRGAYSKRVFEDIIVKYLPPGTERTRIEAARAYEQDALDESLQLLVSTAKANPDDFRLRLDQAKLLVRQGRHEQALEILEQLPNEAFEDPEVDLLCSHLRFIVTAHRAPSLESLRNLVASNASDFHARFQLSARLIMEDDYASAIQHLLQLVRADTPYKEQAYKGILAIIAILGPDHELTKRYSESLELFPR